MKNSVSTSMRPEEGKRSRILLRKMVVVTMSCRRHADVSRRRVSAFAVVSWLSCLIVRPVEQCDDKGKFL